MAWVHAHPIKTLTSADGTRRVLILSRDDGFYMFEAESYWEDEGYTCWLPTQHSRLFDTAETAEREAIGRVPWLRQQVGVS